MVWEGLRRDWGVFGGFRVFWDGLGGLGMFWEEAQPGPFRVLGGFWDRFWGIGFGGRRKPPSFPPTKKENHQVYCKLAVN